MWCLKQSCSLLKKIKIKNNQQVLIWFQIMIMFQNEMHILYTFKNSCLLKKCLTQNMWYIVMNMRTMKTNINWNPNTNHWNKTKPQEIKSK